MKKLLIMATVFAVCGCSELSSFMQNSNSADASTRSKMQSCMLTEAQSRLQAGTLFVNSVSATAKDIAGTCAKKLALSSMGISDDMQHSAEDIITNLRNMSQN